MYRHNDESGLRMQKEGKKIEELIEHVREQDDMIKKQARQIIRLESEMYVFKHGSLEEQRSWLTIHMFAVVFMALIAGFGIGLVLHPGPTVPKKEITP